LNYRHQESVAKLHDLGKSNILDALAKAGITRLNCADGGLPNRAGEEARSRGDSKERFYVSKSFAIGSQIYSDIRIDH
jgi:hypothetical protein